MVETVEEKKHYANDEYPEKAYHLDDHLFMCSAPEISTGGELEALKAAPSCKEALWFTETTASPEILGPSQDTHQEQVTKALEQIDEQIDKVLRALRRLP